MRPDLRRLYVKAYLRKLALDSKPILVGPWRSELGFEALYWLPFLRWGLKYAGINPDRLLVVTRGGASVLYGADSIDIYRLRSVEYVRQENQYDAKRTGIQKQLSCTKWDRDVLTEAAALTFGRGQQFHVLHPSLMYWALEPFWTETRSLPFLGAMTDYQPIPKPPAVQGLTLPEKYVAVKWYGRSTFPYPHPTIQEFVAEVTGNIASRSAVVVLSGGTHSDEHADIPVKGENVHTLPDVPAEQNLALQACVLARATAFVGVYGGMAQLALRLGVPSCSFYADFTGTAEAHLHLSRVLAHKTKVPFIAGSLDDSFILRQVLTPEKVEAKAEKRELVGACE